MRNVRAFILRILSTLFLILTCCLMFSEIISFKQDYVNSEEYDSLSEDRKYTEYYLEQNGYSEYDAKLITDVICSKGFSIEQGKKLLNLRLKYYSDKDIDNDNLFETNILRLENVKSYYMNLYYLTIIICTLTFIIHFLGSKGRGIPFLLIILLWNRLAEYCVEENIFGTSDNVKVSDNMFFAILLMTFSCILWKIGTMYMPKDKQYSILDIIGNKKRCWIECIFTEKSASKTEEVKKCFKCGKSNNITSIFCRSCGVRLIPIERETSKVKVSKGISHEDKRENNDTENTEKEKILELYVIYDNTEFEKNCKSMMYNCSSCNAENLIGTKNCKVCGERM